ncbi:MAG TPA: hypothetical protein VGF71_10385 [Caulobacteraceae bacterium]|jgi:hypothetical protein
MEDMAGDPRGLTLEEAHRLAERYHTEAALRRCAPQASDDQVVASANRILALANFASYVTPAAEVKRQVRRLRKALDECRLALIAINPDALAMADETDRRRVQAVHARLASILATRAMEKEQWRGPPARPRHVRAAVVADSVAEAFVILTGAESSITRPPLGGPGSGRALDLAREVFAALGIKASAESQLRQAIERRAKRKTGLENEA